MKCKILHESKGRIRLHIACRRMTDQEADIVEYVLDSVPGVRQVTVYERTCDVVIHYRENRTAVLQALAKLHFADEKLVQVVPKTTARATNRAYQEKMVNMVAFKAARSLFLPMSLRMAWVAVKSVRFLWRGLRCLGRRKLEVEVLDALSIGISMLRGDFATAGSVMFLLDIGELLEEWTRKKSLDDLARNMSLNIDRVWLKQGDGEVLVPVSQVMPGDCVSVRTGNMIPLDGRVVSGEVMVNQASLTGEAIAVPKSADAYAFDFT